MTRSSAPAPTSTCSPRARTPSRSTSASTPTRRASPSRTPRSTAACASSPPATAPPRAAATSWRWPATRSCSPTTAPARCRCRRCRCSACCRAPAGRRAWGASARCGAISDAFSTLAEGVKGKRAVEWGLVDAVVPRSKFADTVAQRARELAAKAPQVDRGPGIQLDPIGDYKHVSLKVDEKARVADLMIGAPQGDVPRTAAEALAKGAQGWALRMARELDHALLRLRFEHENVGLVIVRTEGDKAKAHAVGELLTGPEKDAWIL